MTEESQPSLNELAKLTEPPTTLVEIAREYSETGRVSAAKITNIVGDQTRSAIMSSTEDAELHFSALSRP